MDQKLSLRLPDDVFRYLREEASKLGISVSDIVRERILRGRSSDLNQGAEPQESSQFQNSTDRPNHPPGHLEEPVRSISETDFAIFEILYLLREFLFERNGQILKRVDEKMEKRFGKERKRIL